MSSVIDSQTVPAELLNVQSTQTLQHLHGQARDILGYCQAYRSGFMNEPGDVTAVSVINCTQHQLGEDQLRDLAEVHRNTGRCSVLVGGQLGLMTQIIPLLKNEGFGVYEAITARVAKSVTNPDGSVTTQRVFKHEGLREL